MNKQNVIPNSSSEKFFVALFLIATVFIILIIKPFLTTIIFTLLIAIYFYPIYDKLVSFLKGKKGIASFITASLILLLIIIPIIIFFIIAIDQAVSFTMKIMLQINNGTISIEDYVSQINNLLSRIPFVDYQISTKIVVNKILENSQSIIQTGTDILVFGSQTAVRVFEQIAVFLFLLYGIFPMLKPLHEKIIKLSPLPHEVDEMILHRLYDMGKAVFLGIVIVGLVQASIGGLGFIIAGIPAVAFWMLLLIIFSIIPILGVGFILVPAIVFTFFQGHVLQSIILFISLLIAINIDNYLRPLLVGKQTAINPVLMIIAILGGLKLFGIFGVFFGPMTLVFVLTLFEAYEKHYVIHEK